MTTTSPTRTTTIQTRLPCNPDQAVTAALDAYAALFSNLERVAIATLCKGEKLDKQAFLKDHGITGRQYNAMTRSAEGKIESQLSNFVNYISEGRMKIAGQQRRIDKKHELIKDQKNVIKVGRLHKAIRQHKSRIQRLEARKAGFELQLKTKRPSICMGSRKLFKQQFNLAENGLADHAEWLELWRRERSSQFFVVGSKDENSGCQGCVILPQADGRYTLQIRLPDALVAAHGQYCYVTDVAFSHDRHWLDQAIASNRARKVMQAEYNRQAKDPEFVGPLDKQSRFLEDVGQAISYRFLRDEKRGWRVLVTTERSGQEISTDRKNGAIGVDVNNHHLSVTEIDRRGIKVGCADLHFRNKENITSAKTETALQMAAVQIVAQAKNADKPIVIEDLDFTIKKAKLQKQKPGSTRLNKVISTLVYRKFRAIIETRAFKEGVEVIVVNPAYTSLIGELKYLNQTENSVHQAAGLVIARRGIGFKDHLPRQCLVPVVRRLCTFLPPVDGRKDESRVLKKAATAYGEWYTSTKEASRKRAKLFRLRRVPELEQILF
jgi:IS605 OrfB family transposase